MNHLNLNNNRLHLGLEFTKDPKINWPLLQRWLKHLGVDNNYLCTTPHLGATNQGDFSDEPERYLKHCLCLSRVFFELIQLPIFDPLEITHIEALNPASKKYQAKILVTAIESIPSSVYRRVLETAFSIVHFMNHAEFTENSRLTIYETIEKRLLKTCRARVPAGKSTIPVLRIAHILGIPFMHLGRGVYQLGWGSKSRRLDRSASDQDTAMGARLSQDKVSTANLLRIAGLPTPDQKIFTDWGEVLTALDQIQFPVVAKPADADRGEGVTVNVNSIAMLEASFEKAFGFSQTKRVIIETQVPGICHRLLVVQGQLLYAVKRFPMSVTGDGQRSIRELVDAAVAQQQLRPPWQRTEIQPLDALAQKTLHANGYSPESIPCENMRIPLRSIESTEWGGVDEDVTDKIHPENLKIALCAAQILGLDIAGIDIISPNIGQPWFENGSIINEVNFAPLLGGAEISRSYLPEFFSRFIDGNGKIPIHQASSLHQALEQQKRFYAAGDRCFITNSHQTLDSDQNPLHMTCNTLTSRIKALISRKDVDAVVFYQ